MAFDLRSRLADRKKAESHDLTKYLIIITVEKIEFPDLQSQIWQSQIWIVFSNRTDRLVHCIVRNSTHNLLQFQDDPELVSLLSWRKILDQDA